MMKTIVSKMATAIAILLFSAGIFSFSKPGGDVFEVYIGKEMVIRQALYSDKGVKEISLSPGQKDEKMSVRFYHCGKAGTKRSITLKDQNDKVLKTLNFSEPRTEGSVMSFPISEIVQFQSGTSESIRLYYSSAELPKGIWLISIAR